ncbi:MAG TPA: hypothetical protein VIC59_02500 [Gemmatimonadota bacterium]|jgi:hypothetical protein
MTAEPPPSTPPPSTPPPPPPAAPPPGAVPGAPPPPKQGLSNAVKLAIGCGIIALLALIVMFTCGIFLKKKLGDVGESVKAGVEDQEAAEKKVAALEQQHPFTPPADGTLDEGQVETFFAVTDEAWGKMKSWIEDMQARGERIDEKSGAAGLGDAVAGVKGYANARVALADAFADHDMSPSAYMWTGLRLMEAHSALASQSPGVPQKNLDIARKYADQIAALKEEGQKTGKGAVLSVAFTLYPRADVMMPPGLDTLMQVPH